MIAKTQQLQALHKQEVTQLETKYRTQIRDLETRLKLGSGPGGAAGSSTSTNDTQAAILGQRIESLEDERDGLEMEIGAAAERIQNLESQLRFAKSKMMN